MLAAFVVAAPISAYGGAMSVFLNNQRTLKAQFWFYAIASITALLAKFWLVKTVGISGVVWGTILGYGLFFTYPAWRLAQKTIDEL